MKKKEGTLLIVDDNQDVLDALSLFLENEFEQVIYLKNPNLVPQCLKDHKIDIVLLDMNYSAGINSGNEGIYWMKEIFEHDPDIIVIPITAYGDVKLAVKALKEGATDFILKPWDNDKLVSTLQAGYKLRKSKKEVINLKTKNEILIKESIKKLPDFIGNSSSIKEIRQIINKIAPTDANVLILGENGTGKELLAKEIYKNSLRSNNIFLSVDLGSLSETLFESELFGYEKGSFTDAKGTKAGRFEAADEGTIFLDEIGNIPLALQTKLLSVIQNKEVYKLGSSSPVPIDIRLICATNRNLEQMIEENLFREDLFYRINTIIIDLPPLRNRLDDIMLLSEFFVGKYASIYNKKNMRITPKAIDKLKLYHWPGNIRELEHTIEKAVILTDGNVLTVDDFNFKKDTAHTLSYSESLTLEQIEKNAIIEALKKHNGNLSEAAKKLAISRQTIYNKMNKYNIESK